MGTLLLDDLHDAVQNQLTDYANQLGSAAQSAQQAIGPVPLIQTPDAPDPNQILAELQQHAADAAQAVQQQTQQIAQPALQVLGQAGQAAGGAVTQLGGNVSQAQDQLAQQLVQHAQDANDTRQQLQDHAATVLGPTDTTQPAGVQSLAVSKPATPTLGGPAPAAAGDVSGGPPAADTTQTTTPAVATPTNSGYVFPVQGFTGTVQDHWGSVKGGSDLMAPRGTPISVMEGGKVIESGWDNVGGNSLLIQGNDGNQYYYAHFDAPSALKVGQTVQAGTYVAPVGNTGDASGGPTHLHIGIGPSILLGADKYGGTGGDYNAVGLLQNTLDAQKQQASAPPTLAGNGPAALAPPTDAAAAQNQTTVGQGQKAFISTLQPLAQQVADKTGINANAMLAIAANETGWGQSSNAQQQNNLFSIQGDGSNGSRWASYKSPTDSFNAFVNLISSAPRYAQAWADRGDAAKFVDDLRTAGYVADEPGFPAQGWVDQVKSIYNNLPQTTPTTPTLGGDTSGASAQRQASATLGGAADTPTAPLTMGVNQPAAPLNVQDQTPTPIQSAQDVAGGAASALGGAANDALEQAKQALQQAQDALGRVAQGAQQAAAPVLGAAQQAVSGAAQDVQQAAQGALGAAQDLNQQTPGTAALNAATPVLGAAASDVGGAASGAAQTLGGAASDVGTAARGAADTAGASADQVRQQVQDTINSLPSNATVAQARQTIDDTLSVLGPRALEIAGDLPLPMGGTVSDLANVGRGVQAGLQTIEEQRQAEIGQSDPVQQFQDNVDAARRGDWGAFAQGTLALAQRPFEPIMGGPSSDLSPSVSAALTAGGIDPNAARVLGQVANVIGPMALERAIPEIVSAASRGADAAATAGLEAIDRLAPPEIASATTRRAGESADDYLARLSDEATTQRPATGAGQLVGPRGEPISTTPPEAPATVGISDTAKEALGYDQNTRQLTALGNVPHEVQGDQVLVPGGNADTLRYVASRIGAASGEDATAATLHQFDPNAPDLAGWRVSGIPHAARGELLNDLTTAGIGHQVLSDGTLRVNALPVADAAHEEALAAAVEKAGAKVEEVNGSSATISPADYQPTPGSAGNRPSGPERGGVPEVGGGVAEPIAGGPAVFTASDTAAEAAAGGRGAAAGRGLPGASNLAPETSVAALLSPGPRPPIATAAGVPEDVRSVYAMTSNGSLEQAAAQSQADMQRLQSLRNGLASDTGPRYDNAGNPMNSAARDFELGEQARAGATAVPNVQTPVTPSGARPINLSTPEQVARLRLQDFPPEVQQTIQDAATSSGWANAQRRGVIPDRVANNLADELANSTSLNQLIDQYTPGQAFNTEQLRALRNAIGGQGVKVSDLAAAISGGDKSLGTAQQFLTEGDKLQRLVQLAEGGRAEVGRAMRAFQASSTLQNLAPEQATAEIASRLARNPDQLAQAVANYQQLVDSGADPVKLAAFWNSFKAPPVTGMDWFKALRYNSMISGVPTIERIGITGALENLYGMAREGGSALVRGKTGEAAAIAKGAWLGFLKGSQNARDTLIHGINEDQALAGGFPRGIAGRVNGPLASGPIRGPIAQRAAQALELPGRLHSALQDVTQGTAYGMRMYQRAAQDADRLQLSGDAAAQHIAEFVNNAPLTQRGRAAMQDAAVFGQRAAMRGDMGTFGSALTNVQQAGPIGHLVLPFARVAYNVGVRGIDRSPLGLLGTMADVARTGGRYARATDQAAVDALGLRGVRPFNERLTDNAIGSLLTGAAYLEANAGNVTGAGPADVNQRDLLQSQGWQPYSLRVGGNYVPYRVLGSWAIPLALAASASEARTYAKAGQGPDDPLSLLGDAARRSGEFAANETYLRDIGNIMRGIQQPDRYGNQFISDMASSVLPYGSLLGNVAQATSGVQRQTSSPTGTSAPQAALNTLTSRIPGLANQLPARTDVLGRPVPTGAGAGFLPEVPTSNRDNVVLSELTSHGVAVPAQNKIATAGQAEAQLTPGEQRAVQTYAGTLIQQNVNQLMADPSYRTASQADQAAMLARAVSVGRAAAEREMLSRLPDNRLQPARQVTITVPVAQRVPLPVP